MDILTIALGITSIIISTVSLFTNNIVSILGILIGLVGFICGYVGKRTLEVKEYHKVYQAGMILSVIGLSISFIILAVFIANISTKTAEEVTSLYNSIVN